MKVETALRNSMYYVGICKPYLVDLMIHINMFIRLKILGYLY